MKRILASILTTLLIIVMTLAAMFVLVGATLKVTAIASPVQRAVAIGAEIEPIRSVQAISAWVFPRFLREIAPGLFR